MRAIYTHATIPFLFFRGEPKEGGGIDHNSQLVVLARSLVFLLVGICINCLQGFLLIFTIESFLSENCNCLLVR